MLRKNTEHIRFRSVNDFPYHDIAYMYVGGKYAGYEPSYLPEEWMPDENNPAVIIPPKPEGQEVKSSWLGSVISGMMSLAAGVVIILASIAVMAAIVYAFLKSL